MRRYRELEDKVFVISTSRKDFENSTIRVTPTYVMNSNENKFTIDETPGRTQRYEFVGEDVYDFTITFQMTKADATDNLIVVLDYRGEIVTIELQKV